MRAKLFIGFLLIGIFLSHPILLKAKRYTLPEISVPVSLATRPPRPNVATLAGRVLNEAGAPVPGVTITVPGAPTSSSTNADGQFLVDLPTANATLVFRSPGYRVQSVRAPTTGPLTVTLYALTGNGTDSNTVKAGETVAADGSPHPAALPYADEMPTFVGGEAALHAFLIRKINYPAEAKQRNLSGTVVVRFVVDEQGRITDAEIAKSCGNGFDEEALRLVRLMPWWTPGRQNGQPVRVVRTMPIIFRLRPGH